MLRGKGKILCLRQGGKLRPEGLSGGRVIVEGAASFPPHQLVGMGERCRLPLGGPG